MGRLTLGLLIFCNMLPPVPLASCVSSIYEITIDHALPFTEACQFVGGTSARKLDCAVACSATSGCQGFSLRCSKVNDTKECRCYICLVADHQLISADLESFAGIGKFEQSCSDVENTTVTQPSTVPVTSQTSTVPVTSQIATTTTASQPATTFPLVLSTTTSAAAQLSTTSAAAQSSTTSAAAQLSTTSAEAQSSTRLATPFASSTAELQTSSAPAASLTVTTGAQLNVSASPTSSSTSLPTSSPTSLANSSPVATLVTSATTTPSVPTTTTEAAALTSPTAAASVPVCPSPPLKDRTRVKHTWNGTSDQAEYSCNVATDRYVQGSTVVTCSIATAHTWPVATILCAPTTCWYIHPTWGPVYGGTTTTSNSKGCQPWYLNTPQTKNAIYELHSMYPSDNNNKTAASIYCRIFDDGSLYTWCYYNTPSVFGIKQYGDCGIAKCSAVVGVRI